MPTINTEAANGRRPHRPPDLTFIVEQLQNQLDDLTETVRLMRDQLASQDERLRSVEQA